MRKFLIVFLAISLLSCGRRESIVFDDICKIKDMSNRKAINAEAMISPAGSGSFYILTGKECFSKDPVIVLSEIPPDLRPKIFLAQRRSFDEKIEIYLSGNFRVKVDRDGRKYVGIIEGYQDVHLIEFEDYSNFLDGAPSRF